MMENIPNKWLFTNSNIRKSKILIKLRNLPWKWMQYKNVHWHNKNLCRKHNITVSTYHMGKRELPVNWVANLDFFE